MWREGVLGTVLLAGAIAPAGACSWVEPDARMNTILARKATYPLTVHGDLVGKERARACGREVLLLRVEVRRAFGGDSRPGDTLVIATNESTASCGYDAPLGSEVVLFADGNPGCDATALPWWTFLPHKNVTRPTTAQLDSLYGVMSLRPARARPLAAGAHGRGLHLGGGIFTMLQGRGNAATLGPCRTDGRVLPEGIAPAGTP